MFGINRKQKEIETNEKIKNFIFRDLGFLFKNFKFVQNSPGSGVCEYEINNNIYISYNQFPDIFDGFYINRETEIEFKDLLKLINK